MAASTAFTSNGVNPGCFERISATMPATWGAAKLFPVATVDPPPKLVGLGRVQVYELLELERELAAEHPSVIEVPAQEDLVHPAQVLLVEEVLVTEELLVDFDLGRLQLNRRDDAVVCHRLGV